MTTISNSQTAYSYTTKGTVDVKVESSDAKVVATVKKTDGRLSDNKDTIKISDEGQEALLKLMNKLWKEVLPQDSKEVLFEKARQSITPLSLEELRKDDETRFFSGSSDSYAFLGKMLGLKGTFSDKSSFLDSLNNQIAGESKALTKDLSAVLQKAGLGDVTKKITFSEDANGNIVVEGNISAKQKKQIARLVNADSELVERIKTQKAGMEIAQELEKDKPDLSHTQFNAARTQILKDYLKKNDDELPDDLLKEYSDLESTLHIQPGASPRTNSTLPVRSLLSMKRGVLSEADDAKPDFGSQVKSLRESISDTIVGKINEMFKDDEDLQIRDYKIIIDSTGRIRFTDVRTKGNNPEADLRATALMNSKIDAEMQDFAKTLGAEIMNVHDAKLPEKYSGLGDKLIALKAAKGKLHDQSLLPKDGIHFTF